MATVEEIIAAREAEDRAAYEAQARARHDNQAWNDMSRADRERTLADIRQKALERRQAQEAEEEAERKRRQEREITRIATPFKAGAKRQYLLEHPEIDDDEFEERIWPRMKVEIAESRQHGDQEVYAEKVRARHGTDFL